MEGWEEKWKEGEETFIAMLSSLSAEEYPLEINTYHTNSFISFSSGYYEARFCPEESQFKAATFSTIKLWPQKKDNFLISSQPHPPQQDKSEAKQESKMAFLKRKVFKNQFMSRLSSQFTHSSLKDRTTWLTRRIFEPVLQAYSRDSSP